jgi:hypothetical protein
MDNQDLCEQMFRHLSEFLDRETTDDLRARLEVHLTDCTSCRCLWNTIQGTVGMVHDLGAREVPHECLARLRNRLLRGTGRTGS